MNLQFLISISSVSENLYGVRFLRSFLGDMIDCDVTLFHIASDSAHNRTPASLMQMWEAPDGSDNVTPGASARKALQQSKRILCSGCLDERSLTTKTLKERYGKIRDILTEAANGLYDAMILGRRATYALQWMFERPADEIPQAMIRDAALSSPIWICSEPEEGRKNVLACIDGSLSSFRAVDHVGYILSFLPHHDVTLLHVSPPLQKPKGEIFTRGEQILHSYNLPPERIHTKTVTSLSIVNAIVEEEKKGRFAAVALGLHRYAAESRMDPAKGVGKTTIALLKKITRASLWCCP